MPDFNDPSSLTDEELDQAILGEEPEGEPEEPVVPAPNEEEEPEVPEEGEPEAPEPEEEPEEPAPPSRREQLRINQLLEKMKQPQREPEQPQANPNVMNYAEELDADPEMIQRLEADRQRAIEFARGQNETQRRQTESIEWRTMLHIDAPQVESKYEILNPKDQEHFHPVLADSLSKWYLNSAQFDPETRTVGNPSVRWGEFVDGVMELAEEIASTKVASATKNIKSQAAHTGLRPDGSSAKKLNLNQAPESMTDEELDAIIGQAIPSR